MVWSFGVDHGLACLSISGFSTCVLAAIIGGAIENRDTFSLGDRLTGVGGYGCVDSVCKAVPILVICVPLSAPMDLTLGSIWPW